MKKKLLIASLLALVSYTVQAAYVPLTIASGFNADVIANGVGTAVATTTGDVDGVNYCFVSNGWQLTAASVPLTTGLPATGLVNSAVTPGLTFQMAPYTGNNDLRLPTNTSATLAFQTPYITAQNLYFLAVTGSGSSTMTVTVNFTDLTTQVSPAITVADWYGGSSVALTGFQRLDMATNTPNSSTFPLGPNLYQYTVPINAANQSKQIASVLITRTSGTGAITLNVFAVTAESAVTCAAPTAPNATGMTTTSAILNWTQTGTPGQWQIKYGPTGFNVNTAGTSIFTATKPYTLNPPLTVATTYDYYVRAVCGPNDTSFWSPVTTFSTTCVAPTIVSKTDSFGCGPGAVVLKATASTGGSIKWYSALTGGTALFTGNVYTTPSIAATTTYYIAAAAGTCESTPRQAVIASVRPIPVVNIGNDTTICPGITYTMNAGNAGATYLWNTNATTQSITANTAGNYSVLVSLNGCNNSDARVITAGIVPQNNLAATLDLCEGDVATLNAGNSGSSFLWTPGGATTQTVNITTGGIKSVAIKSTTGCIINSSTNVTLRPLPVINLGNDTSICEGASITLDAGNPSNSYAWTPGGATTQTILASDSGTYEVTVTTAFNCESTDERHIAYLPSPRVEGFNFIPLFYEDLGKVKFTALNPTSVTSYLWDFGDGSATSTLVSPTHTYPATGSYTAKLKVFNGCSEYETSLLINVDLITGIVTLDKDEANIVLYPNPSSNVLTIDNRSVNLKLQEVTIFNTLGAVVYKGKLSGNREQVQVSQLASGIYSMRILTDKGFVVRKFEVRP
jgi:hypothetical protein